MPGQIGKIVEKCYMMDDSPFPEFSTPGTGFLVSANAGLATPTLFDFSNDFQTFSAQRLFTAVGSNITDVLFFAPGTMSAATTSAFAAIFVDVEAAAQTKIEFFDENNSIIFSRDALLALGLADCLAGLRRCCHSV